MQIQPINNTNFNARCKISGATNCIDKNQINEIENYVKRIGNSRDALSISIGNYKIIKRESPVHGIESYAGRTILIDSKIKRQQTHHSMFIKTSTPYQKDTVLYPFTRIMSLLEKINNYSK